ncbi:ABC transporter transmembrane domain-containing protein [Candidatus Raskinella chloraquaticus]|uniref:ABC transporter transmembrane domain-containing protein n=1 Tax=Candidatus Raskinella chloraquaticus TaxID=1951219 RepID=UPI00378645FA
MNEIDPRLFRYIWRYSRRDQLVILVLILLQLPFFFATLELPKRIVNEGIQGGAFRDGQLTANLLSFSIDLPDFLGGWSVPVFSGFLFNQLHYLLVLSGIFLLLTLINGWFRYEINLRKGVLGERMMRRLRFDLFATLLCFRPEDIRTVKPAEVASMIKDEVEPIGGFIGDAFVQPAMLGTQALTALAFIMIQSLWLGLMAGGIVAVQAVIIPYLRKEQLRLGRERQLASRELAGRIGEIVDAAPAVLSHGVREYSHAEISQRLSVLFNIRVALYNRKFAVKFLNALLSQITPFFFYSIGGYLALKGSLDIGQLVAVIAAYRELPAPVKELIDWDQQAADMSIKYEQIVSQFSPTRRLASLNSAPVDLPSVNQPIQFDDVRVADGRGAVMLESMNARIARPGTVALVGAAGSGRDSLARILGQQISGYRGKVTCGATDFAQMSSESLGRLVGYVGPEPYLINATIRQNILFSLQRHGGQEAFDPKDRDAREAKRAGLPYWRKDNDWLDYTSVGDEEVLDLDSAVIAALRLAGGADEVYFLGLEGPLDIDLDHALEARIVAARASTRARLETSGLSKLITFFDPDGFNRNASIAENLLFGLPIGDRLANNDLCADRYVRSILEAEALVDPLINIGLRMAEFTIDMFSSLPPGGAIVERMSFIRAADMPDFRMMVETAQAPQGRSHLTYVWRFKLVALALGYCEARHRLGLVDDVLVERILRARRSFSHFLPANYARYIEFYRPDRVIRGAPLRDNLLFGRVNGSVANAERRVAAFLSDVLRETGLEDEILRIGLSTPCGQSGRLLTPTLRHAVNLARSLVKRPQILVYEAGYIAPNAHEKVAGLARALPATTIFVSLDEGTDAATYSTIMRFEGARLQQVTQPGGNAQGMDLEQASG